MAKRAGGPNGPWVSYELLKDGIALATSPVKRAAGWRWRITALSPVKGDINPLSSDENVFNETAVTALLCPNPGLQADGAAPPGTMLVHGRLGHVLFFFNSAN